MVLNDFPRLHAKVTNDFGLEKIDDSEKAGSSSGFIFIFSAAMRISSQNPTGDARHSVNKMSGIRASTPRRILSLTSGVH